MNLGNIVVYISANAAGFAAGVTAAQNQLNSLKGSVTGFAQSAGFVMARFHNGWYNGWKNAAKQVDAVTAHISRSTRIQGFVISAIGITIMRNFRKITEAASELERKYNNIVQAMGEKQIQMNWTPAELEQEALKFRGIIEDTSTHLGRNMNEMYDLLIEGLQNGLEATEEKVAGFASYASQIQMLDPAGNATLAEAGEILTRIFNIYPDLAKQFESYDDFLYYIRNEVIATVNQAQSSISEYSAGLAELQGLSTVLFKDQKLAFEEANSAFAALTRLTTPGEAVTMVRSLMTNVLKQTDQTVKLAKLLGIEYNTHALEQKGILQFTKDIYEQIQKSLIPGTREYNNLTAALQEKAAANVKDTKNWAIEVNKLYREGIELTRKRKSLLMRLREIQTKEVKSADDIAAKNRAIFDIQTRLYAVGGDIEDKMFAWQDAQDALAKSVAKGGVVYNRVGQEALEYLERLKNGTLNAAEVMSQLTGRKEATQGLLYLGQATQELNGQQVTLAQLLQATRGQLRKIVDQNMERKLDEVNVLLGQIKAEGLALIITWFRQNEPMIREFLNNVILMLRRGRELLDGATPNSKLEKLFIYATSPEFAKILGTIGVLFILLGPALIMISAISDLIGFIFMTLHGIAVLAGILFMTGPIKTLMFLAKWVGILMSMLFGAPATGSWFTEIFLVLIPKAYGWTKNLTLVVWNYIKNFFLSVPRWIRAFAGWGRAAGQAAMVWLAANVTRLDAALLAGARWLNKRIILLLVWISNNLLLKMGNFGLWVDKWLTLIWNRVAQSTLLFLRGGFVKTIITGLRTAAIVTWAWTKRSIIFLFRTVIWGTIQSAWVWLVGAITTLAAALGLPVWAVVAIILAAVLLVAGIIYYFWDEIVAYAKWGWGNLMAIWEWFKPVAIAFWEMVKAIAIFIWTWMQIIWEYLKLGGKYLWSFVVWLFETIVGIIAAIAYGLWEAVKWVWNVIVSFFKWVWGLISGFFVWVWDNLKQLLSLIWPHTKAFLNFILSLFGTSMDEIIEDLKRLWNWLNENIFDRVTVIFGGVMDAIEDIWNSSFDRFFGDLEKLKNKVIDVFGSIRDFFTGATVESQKILDDVRQKNENYGRRSAKGYMAPRGGSAGSGRIGDTIPLRVSPGESVLTRAETNRLAAISNLLAGPILSDLMVASTALAGGATMRSSIGDSRGQGSRIEQTIQQTNNIYTEVDYMEATRALARRARRNIP